jgi:hypothetical protein
VPMIPELADTLARMTSQDTVPDGRIGRDPQFQSPDLPIPLSFSMSDTAI